MPVPSPNTIVVIHSLDVFDLLILPFDYGLSVLNFPASTIFFVILHFSYTKHEFGVHNYKLGIFDDFM